MAIAPTHESGLCLPNLQPVWHHKAPRRLVEKCPADDIYSGWKVWQDHLRSRKKPEPPRLPANKSKSPLLWGWPHELDRNAVKESIGSPSTLAESLIGNDSTDEPDLPLALQIVALAYAMPDLSRELPAEAWWPLLERLQEVATQAQTKRVDWPANPRDVLRHQLLAGELPFVLAYLFPEVRAMRALRNSARESLSEAIVALTDGRGTPDARLLPVLGPLFACWTRVRSLGPPSKSPPLVARSRAAIPLARAPRDPARRQERPVHADAYPTVQINSQPSAPGTKIYLRRRSTWQATSAIAPRPPPHCLAS